MTIKTLLYGGAFDMPHVGHVNVAHNTLNYLSTEGFKDLWFLPCYSDAFGNKNMAGGHHRVAMLSLLIKDLPSKFKICLDELELKNNSGTYAILCHLIRTYKRTREFTYLVGTDQADQIDRWRNSRKLRRMIPFVVVKRFTGTEQHQPVKTRWYHFKPHIFINSSYGMETPISSTAIRNDFAKDWDSWKTKPHKFLLPSVQNYILENGLYKNKGA